MVRNTLPYPPSPKNVPDDLARATPKLRAQAALLVLSLFVFLLVYLGLAYLAVFLIVHGVTRPFSIWHLLGIILGIFLLMYLLKGLFVRHKPDKTLQVELKEEDHPALFEFIERLCDEVDAPYPDRVIVSPEVNAAVIYDQSLANLFVTPRKTLLIGLGLVNSLNLSEFKSVVAHELGHFVQKSFLTSYSYVAIRVIIDMVGGRDWFDEMLDKLKRVEGVGIVAWALAGVIGGVRRCMLGLLYVITFLRFAVGRQHEFHADLVAVSVTGSDALIHGLLRSEHAFVSFNQALEDLRHAADHHIYTDDLFYHQNHAYAYIRKKRKDRRWGEPPNLRSAKEGREIQVFPEEEDESDIPPMWRTHPSNYEREENAKERFIPCPIDERSPWVLFGDTDDLRARVAYRFYRVAFKVPKDAELSEPPEVQRFIDDEHAEMTYDPKYGGCYDERAIDPGDLTDIDRDVDGRTWNDQRLEQARAELYAEELGQRAKRYNHNRSEAQTVLRQCNFRPRQRAKRILEKLDAGIKKDAEWFSTFDRRVYLVHAQMARGVDKRLFEELLRRYRFHLRLQDVHRSIAGAQNGVDAILSELNKRGDDITPDFFAEVMHTFREGREALRQALNSAKEMRVPAMANMPEGTDLARFLLEKPLLSDLPEYGVKGKWISKLLGQMMEMRSKVNRLDFKSLGALLKLQDRVAQLWHERRAAGETAPLSEGEIEEAVLVEDEEEGGAYGLKED
jgi:Zn-dependent protease with chaperone function